MPSCGDGEQEGEEGCDDGNTDDEDGCSSSCEVEEGWACPRENEPCVDCRTGAEPESCPRWYCPEGEAECIDCNRGPTLDCPCTDADYLSGEYLLGVLDATERRRS